jgi:GNAT superfamily N-acetyltransferase
VSSEFHRNAASVLARAFIDDPAVVWALPRREDRERHLCWLFEKNIAAFSRSGGWFDLQSAPECYNDPLGAAVWHSGASPYVSFTDEMIAGFWSMPARLGIRATMRFLKMTEYWRKWREQALSSPHYYLALLGVIPEARGRGLARKLLVPVLKKADEVGWTVALETHLESNVGLYRKFGFELRSSDRIAAGGPTCFTMLRPPAQRTN